MSYLQIEPSVTRSDLLRNNTSAADSFAGLKNGVPPAGNVSKLPLDLNPGQGLVAFMEHFYHSPRSGIIPDIGYNSNDPAYQARALADLQLRGVGFTLNDWYGPNSYENQALLAQLKVASKATVPLTPGWMARSAPCLNARDDFKNSTNKTALLITWLDYIAANMINQVGYWRINFRPVIAFFGIGAGSGVDWNAVNAHLALAKFQNPYLVYRWELNWSLQPRTDAIYGWISCDDNWYLAAQKKGKPIWGGVNPGFNNTDRTICSWGTPQVIDAQGGLRFLNQVALAKKYNTPFALLVTYNDYPEDSCLEPGIPGIAVSATVANNALRWLLERSSQVVDHYEVLIARADLPDSLAPLTGGIGPAQSVELDLVQFDLLPGNYVLYVRAVGRGFMRNALSAPVAVSVKVSVTATAA